MRSYWMQMAEPARLELRETATPTAGPRQLLVRMRAASLNRGELMLGNGPQGQPGTWKALGGEGAGEVGAVGAEVKGFKAGDRVMGRCSGAFADYALMAADEAMAVPARLSFEQAASIPLTFLVAFDMLVLQGRLAAGEWLLINGVSSGVGVASLQIGKALGACVIGTSGSDAKLALLEPLGLDLGLCTRRPDFANAVLQATDGRGADLIVNSVGGSVFEENLRALAFQGRHATVGHVDGVLRAELDLELLHMKRLTLFGVSNKLRSVAQRAQTVARFGEQILPLLADGRIEPMLDSVTEFEQLPVAKARMEADAHVGKLVLRIAASGA